MGIEDTIRNMVRRWGMSPISINSGACDEFAENLLRHYPEGILVEVGLKSDIIPGHAVVKYRGRYYDAETPKGVKRANDLPIVKRLGLGRTQWK